MFCLFNDIIVYRKLTIQIHAYLGDKHPQVRVEHRESRGALLSKVLHGSRLNPRVGSRGFQTLPGRVGLGHEVVRTLTGWNGSSQEAFKSYGLVRVTLTRLDPREVTRPVNSPAIFAPEPFGGGESQRAPHTPHANGVKGVTSRKQHPTDVVVVEVRLPGAVTSTHDAVKTIPRKRKSLLTEAERHIDVR